MQPKLIALDIDGTLIAPGAHYSELPAAPMTRVIQQLIDAGVAVVLATGRMVPGTLTVAQHLGVHHPVICQQGAALHSLDGDVLQQFSIDPVIARELVDYARTEAWPFSWFDAQRYMVSEPNDAAQYFADVSGVSVEICAEPEASGVAATGIDIISTPEAASGVHKTLAQRYGDRVELLDFTRVTAVHSPLSSKGNSLALLAADLGVHQGDVLAIGDSANDASMLAWAGNSAAPAHCDSYARAAADEILAGDSVDGVCELLQRVLAQVTRRS